MDLLGYEAVIDPESFRFAQTGQAGNLNIRKFADHFGTGSYQNRRSRHRLSNVDEFSAQVGYYSEGSATPALMLVDEGDTAESLLGSARTHLFKALNLPELDEAALTGKTTKFSHDPEDADAGPSLKAEWAHLKSAHRYEMLEKKEDGFWHAIR